MTGKNNRLALAAKSDRRDLPRRLLFVRAADLLDRIGG